MKTNSSIKCPIRSFSKKHLVEVIWNFSSKNENVYVKLHIVCQPEKELVDLYVLFKKVHILLLRFEKIGT